MRSRRFWIITALVVVAAVIALTTLLSHHNGGRGASLDILVAPSGSSLKIDGKSAKSGLTEVAPGQHTVLVQKTGFITQQQQITLADKETRFVGIILVSNSPETADWYKTHDADLVQSIENRLFDQSSKDVVQANPLLKLLPHVGPALTYRVDYGVPSDNSKTGQPAIYIRYRTEHDKESALQWIKDQGVDPAKQDIVYIQGNF